MIKYLLKCSLYSQPSKVGKPHFSINMLKFWACDQQGRPCHANSVCFRGKYIVCGDHSIQEVIVQHNCFETTIDRLDNNGKNTVRDDKVRS